MLMMLMKFWHYFRRKKNKMGMKHLFDALPLEGSPFAWKESVGHPTMIDTKKFWYIKIDA